MWKILSSLFFFACGLVARATDDGLDRLGDALTFANPDKTLRGKASGTFDLEIYQLAQPNPFLIFTDRHSLINPRLTMFFDGRWGPQFYGFVQARADQGFDPNADTPHFRWDEYALRFSAGHERSLVLEAGKFATVLGNWIPRHGSWENPFIGAPLPYENVTAISGGTAPATSAEFVPPSAGEKYEYSPVIWGPSYATGASVSGALGQFDYAFEVKNAGPSSAPERWTISYQDFSNPSYTARMAFRPDMRWCFGLSASDSGYFEPSAASTLPPGRSVRSYRQRLVAQDASIAWHQLQLWAELFECSFDVPRLGKARTWAGYFEAKYKLTPQLHTAIRLNRQEFTTMKSGATTWHWGDNTWRFDFATGYRFTPHTRLKLELSFARRDQLPDQVNAAAQFTIRF